MIRSGFLASASMAARSPATVGAARSFVATPLTSTVPRAGRAWKLALVIKGGGSDALLDSYNAERGHIGDQGAVRLRSTCLRPAEFAQTQPSVAAMFCNFRFPPLSAPGRSAY